MGGILVQRIEEGQMPGPPQPVIAPQLALKFGEPLHNNFIPGFPALHGINCRRDRLLNEFPIRPGKSLPKNKSPLNLIQVYHS